MIGEVMLIPFRDLEKVTWNRQATLGGKCAWHQLETLTFRLEIKEPPLRFQTSCASDFRNQKQVKARGQHCGTPGLL